MSTVASPALGMIRGEPIDVYHGTDALSKSKLSDFMRSPLLYFRRYVEKTLPREPLSQAFLTGQGAHTLTLEGRDEYEKRFIVVPLEAPRRPTAAQRGAKKPSDETVASIAWWDEFDRSAAGKTVITEEDDATHYAISESVHAHAIAAALLSEGEAEVTFRVKADRYAIQCRPDWTNFGASAALVERLRALGVKLDVGEPYCVDLKTVETLTESDFHSFTKNFLNFGYHQQGPLYRAVIRDAIDLTVTKFFFVPVEKSELFQSAVYLPDEAADAQGWEEITAALNRLNRCYDTGEWPGAPRTLQSISLPDWYLRKAGAL